MTVDMGIHPAQIATPPLARGVTWRRWILDEITRQATTEYSTHDPASAPIQRKPVWSPRDDYGWRSLGRR